MRATIKFMLRAAAAIAFASVLAPFALCQQGGRNASEEFERAMREAREREVRDNELRERAFDLRMVEERARRRRPERREPKLAYAQIREDFRRLQVVNYDLAEAVTGRGALDLKFVAKSASEIKKLAGRLKDNMVLPELENLFERPQSEVGAEDEQLRSSLSVLSKLIIEFVDNPIFRETNVVDVQLSAKARRDLEDIVEVSDQIKKSSEKLSKTAHKTH